MEGRIGFSCWGLQLKGSESRTSHSHIVYAASFKASLKARSLSWAPLPNQADCRRLSSLPRTWSMKWVTRKAFDLLGGLEPRWGVEKEQGDYCEEHERRAAILLKSRYSFFLANYHPTCYLRSGSRPELERGSL